MPARYLFIINPISGGIDKQLIEDFVAQRAQQEGFDYKIYKTSGTNDEKQIGHLVSNYAPGVVVVSGGDGSLLMVSCLLKNSGQLIGLFPSGSANGMAAELNIPPIKGITIAARQQSLMQCWELIKRGTHRNIDMIKINEHYSIHLSDAGFNAQIVRGFEAEGGRGLLGYARQFIKKMTGKKKQFKYHVTMEGRHLHGKAVMLAIANARSYGTGAIINPNGQPDDGVVELVIIKNLNMMLLLNAATSIVTEAPDYHPDHLEITSCRKARIGFSKQLELQVDGEVAGRTRQLDIEVLPGAVKLIC
jgi:diacylglycerol kinase family enzyme